MATLEETIQKARALREMARAKKKMGTTPPVQMEAKPPLLRQKDQPLAVMGRSELSQSRASERQRGISERLRKMEDIRWGRR